MAKKETKAAPTERNQPANIEINNITIGQLTRGNQTVQTWISNVKRAENELWPDRRGLYDTYLDVTIDGYLQALMAKRIREITTTPWEWQNLTDEKVKENLGDEWFIDLLRNCGMRTFWGTTLVDHKISSYDGMINAVDLVPRQNVKPEKGIIMKDGYSDVGEGNIIHYREGIYQNYVLEIGGKRELGMLANIAAYILMKRNNLSDLSRYNEMFGMDLRVYKYDPTKPGARMEAEKSAKEYGSAAYIVIPRNYADIEFIASNKQSSSSAYATLHEILKNEITISVLGESLTTGGEGGGSYELGKVHQNVSAKVAMEDRMAVEYILNYKFKNNILIPHGYPMQGIKGVFKVPDTLPKELKAAMWINLAKSGLPIAEEDFYKEFGVPMPNGRPLLVVPPTTTIQPPPDPNNPDDPNNTKPEPKPKPQGGADGKKQKLSAQLHALYAHKCERDKSPGRVNLSYKSELDEVIDNMINKLRTGEMKAGDVDSKLYNLVGEELYKGVEKGYGMKLAVAEETDAAVIKALRENVYRFSGFKNYHFVKEANGLLIDEHGNVKPFDAFRNDVLKLNDQYNKDFLRTEYNHAVASSRMASKWQKFESDKGTLPLLQYDTVGDGRVRLAHQGLDGIIKPVDDPFWNKYLPPLDWNCRCTVRQLAEGEATATNDDQLPQIKKDFQHNWGKERVIFPPDHPQFEVDPQDQKNADNNFGLPLP